jgi:uncharacterized membrane protein
VSIKPNKFLGYSLLVILLLAIAAVIVRINILLILPTFAALTASVYQYTLFLRRRNKNEAAKKILDLYYEDKLNELGGFKD